MAEPNPTSEPPKVVTPPAAQTPQTQPQVQQPKIKTKPAEVIQFSHDGQGVERLTYVKGEERK